METSKENVSYGQYKNDFFRKLNFHFIPGKSILDIGCGDGVDAEIFIDKYRLVTTAIDVYEHPRIHLIDKLSFHLANIIQLPFDDNSFDYVFLHDVLHHVDEKDQSKEKHLGGLYEVRRVIAKSGTAVIVEANRYNPISYFHMVKRHGHEHWRQSYFREIVRQVFPEATFRTFEAHAYPWGYPMWRVYEYFLENMKLGKFHSYNVAIISFQ